MSWPSFEEFVPEPLRGGEFLPSADAYKRQHQEAWRRYVAKRVQGAEDQAIALVTFSSHVFVGPFTVLFDGRVLEVAKAAGAGVSSTGIDLRELGLPASGMFMSHGGVATWRESLTPDRAAHLWRDLGGDEAFALPLDPPRVGPVIDGWETYVIVRRGAERVRLELGTNVKLSEASRAWLGRFAPYLRAQTRASLLR